MWILFLRETVGNLSQFRNRLHDVRLVDIGTICAKSLVSNLARCCFFNLCKTKSGVLKRKKLWTPMNSHGIPSASDENETRGTKRPQDQIKTLAGSYRHLAFIRPRDPARERADIPPGGARSRTSPPRRDGRRVDQWQQINPPFLLPPQGQRFKARMRHRQG